MGRVLGRQLPARDARSWQLIASSGRPMAVDHEFVYCRFFLLLCIHLSLSLCISWAGDLQRLANNSDSYVEIISIIFGLFNGFSLLLVISTAIIVLTLFFKVSIGIGEDTPPSTIIFSSFKVGSKNPGIEPKDRDRARPMSHRRWPYWYAVTSLVPITPMKKEKSMKNFYKTFLKSKIYLYRFKVMLFFK